jgi:hypothetical protein
VKELFFSVIECVQCQLCSENRSTVDPLVPGSSHLEVEIAITKLKIYKSPDNDQIPAEVIQGGGETLLSMIHKLINSIWNKEELPDQWKESIIVPVHKKRKTHRSLA